MTDNNNNRKRQEEHEGRGRLLRYQEFIQNQEQNMGLVVPEHWAFDGHGPELDCLKQEKEEEEEDKKNHNKDDNDADDDLLNKRKSSMPNEYDLTRDVILDLANVFTMGFYNYVNHDKIYAGLAAGTESAPVHVPSPRRGVRALHIDASLGTFIEQTQEVRDRYLHWKCPLGPPYTLGNDSPMNKKAARNNNINNNNNNNKKKGKKKRGGGGGNNNSTAVVTHASEIKVKATALLQALYKHSNNNNNNNPSIAMGQLLLVMTEMFSAGVSADVDLARAVLWCSGNNENKNNNKNGEQQQQQQPLLLLLQLRKAALDNAVKAETGVDCMTRPKLAAGIWWKVEQKNYVARRQGRAFAGSRTNVQ